MDRKWLLPAACIVVGIGPTIISGQSPVPSTVFTPAQAEAGRAAYEKTCGKCHTLTLFGRKGETGELPPLSSLSTTYQEFITKFGPVPALAGKAFVARWQDKTMAQVIARFEEAVRAFPPEGTNAETTLEIAAYALQVSGAKPGDRALTRSSSAIVRDVVRSID